MGETDFSFGDVLMKQEPIDEVSFTSQLINNHDANLRAFAHSSDPIPATTIQTSEPRIFVRKSIYIQKESEQKNQRTVKRSQSSIQREAENHSSYDRGNKSSKWSRPYEESNNIEYMRRDSIYQNPSTSRNMALPVRTNDPRLNRRTDNGSNLNPPQNVSLPRDVAVATPQINFNLDAVLYRCTKALELIRDLKNAETFPIIMFKYSNLNRQKPTSQEAKKSPLILNSKNVVYMLQASGDSSTECHTAMLSRQYKNISFRLQSTMRVIGADIERISTSVANAELKRQKEESKNESLGIVYSSDKKSRTYETQTEDDYFEDKKPPKTYADMEISCNIVVPMADKRIQTTVNTDGFSFSIESLMLLTPAQRQKLQEFKKIMNMSDDGKIGNIRERQQHRKVNALIYGREEDSNQYMNPCVSKYVAYGPPR